MSIRPRTRVLIVTPTVAAGTLYSTSIYSSQTRCPRGDYIAATVDLRKRCKSLKGVAGRRRFALMKAMACDEKVVTSKVTHMRSTAPADAGMVLQDPVPPSSSDGFEA